MSQQQQQQTTTSSLGSSRPSSQVSSLSSILDNCDSDDMDSQIYDYQHRVVNNTPSTPDHTGNTGGNTGHSNHSIPTPTPTSSSSSMAFQMPSPITIISNPNNNSNNNHSLSANRTGGNQFHHNGGAANINYAQISHENMGWDISGHFDIINSLIGEMEIKVSKETPSRNIIDYKIFMSLIASLKGNVFTAQSNLQALLNEKETQIEDLITEYSKLKSKVMLVSSSSSSSSSSESSGPPPTRVGPPTSAPHVHHQHQQQQQQVFSLLEYDTSSDNESDGENQRHPRKMLKREHTSGSSKHQHKHQSPKKEPAPSKEHVSKLSNTKDKASGGGPKEEGWASEVLMNLIGVAGGPQLPNLNLSNLNNLNNGNNSNNSTPSNTPPHLSSEFQEMVVPQQRISLSNPNPLSRSSNGQATPNTNTNSNSNTISNPSVSPSSSSSANRFNFVSQDTDFTHSSSDEEDGKPNEGAPGTVGRKKKRGKLPSEATGILKKWLFEHNMHPYPTEEEKTQLTSSTHLSFSQINNWFTNARRRILPRQMDRKTHGSGPLYSHFLQGYTGPVPVSVSNNNNHNTNQHVIANSNNNNNNIISNSNNSSNIIIGVNPQLHQLHQLHQSPIQQQQQQLTPIKCQKLLYI
ncbi:hypothetical protein SAMD00019534_099470 [Acytostelium subglobosum LB1]|uniref:hypothetical protein n=1 Tax=Acytostelium subglobosum LB1 TaxID=1410327 RepID=UPI0006449700|nr:hypothetical protein SAMD00019534_099470 [Acytostelium subglobosum LB1]GAM26772.1 hypothetical protein SAMD00019534_099470 [Acytostelium subglobosum LB1]|eukprot:XP_012750433.1 hypothetical protein SAMD00019534_099470 [Acytostelium subglobosum LB1]